jgi:23S rRNA G2445 N2-methylase RlmL
MPNVEVTTRVLLRIEAGLLNIEAVVNAAARAGRPIPPAKTSYALSKWGEHAETLANSYRKELRKQLEARSKKDASGKAIQVVSGNTTQYDIEDLPAFSEQNEAMLDEVVTMAGVRELAIADFGDFNIPSGDMRMLLGTVLTDAEPK